MTPQVNKEIELEIAHVLFIDIVGYSKLSINEQRAAVDELNEIVRAPGQFQKAEAAGRLIKIPTGDGMALVFYTGPEAAAQCAIEISRTLKKHPQLQLRMGVHSGPVSGVIDVNGHANLAGAGLNVAQRVMSCGDGGHILLSKRVAEDLAEYEHWRPLLHDLGTCEVKHGMRIGVANLHDSEIGNPQLPKKLQVIKRHRTQVRWAEVAIALLVLVAIIAAFVFLLRRPTRSAMAIVEKSIAVLPFQNRSRDPDNAYFADGIQDEILTRLSKITDLKVISRTSTQHYKSAPENLPDIARQLGVAHIVEGSVQKSGDAVRVNVQLIKAANDSHLWADTYDRTLIDIFSVESEVAKAIADQLRVHLRGQEEEVIAAKPTENGEAYLAFMRAHDAQGAYEDFDKLKLGEQMYERAIALDPKFALAFARYSQLESWIVHTFERTPARQEKARVLAERAIQLQPELPEAHLALGFVYYYAENNYDAAAAEFEIARRGLPNEAEVYLALGAIERRQGEWSESTASLEKAVSLNPKDTWSMQNLAINYEMLRNYKAANETVERALAINPKALGVLELKAKLALEEKGDFSVAEKVLAEVTEMPQTPEVQTRLAVGRISLFLLLRRFEEAAHESDRLSDSFLARYPGALCGKYVDMGIAKKAIHDDATAREFFLKAKSFAEDEIKQSPDYAAAHGRLAEALAWLGEKDAALAEVKRAQELLPETKDAFEGPEITNTAAEVHAILGDASGAVAILDGLLQRPSTVTVPVLKLNPIWDPIRNDPRFQALLDKYGAKA